MDSFVTFLRLTLLSMVPFVLAAQGTMLGGRTGVFNVAQEGIMLVGASLGFMASYMLGGNTVAGIVAAMLVGGHLWPGAGVLHHHVENESVCHWAVAVVHRHRSVHPDSQTDHWHYPVAAADPNAARSAHPAAEQNPVPWPDLFNHNILVYFSILLSIGLWYFLFRTQLGLELRSVGENPNAADSLGINTVKHRYVTAIIGGMLIGLAGVYLPMVYTGTFTEGMVKGRGWLTIALTFFAGWSPLPVLYGSLFFAGIEVASYRFQAGGIAIPYQYLLMVPYLATILVMMFTFRRTRVPSFLGNNYDREKRSL